MKKRIRESALIKTFTFTVAVIALSVMVLCMIYKNWFDKSGHSEESLEEAIDNAIAVLAENKLDELTRLDFYDDTDKVIRACENTNVQFSFFGGKYTYPVKYYDGKSTKYIFRRSVAIQVLDETKNDGSKSTVYCRFTIYIDEDMPHMDEFRKQKDFLTLPYMPARYSVMAIILSAITSLLCVSFLLWSGGWRKQKATVTASGIQKLPIELYLFITAGVTLYIWRTLVPADWGTYLWEVKCQWNSLSNTIWSALAVVFVWSILLVSSSVVLAIQLKAKILWKDSVVHFLCRMVYRGICMLIYIIRNFNCVIRLLHKKCVAAILCVFLVEGWMYFLLESKEVGIIWLAERVIFLLVLLYFMEVLYKLKDGGEKLVDGQLSYQVDTSGMYGTAKKHGENLNSIRLSINREVEERLKSERLKTELITNVSHDLKTPLTSIINYVDLIETEKTENERIIEYAQVLSRQANRLKKLIENLVEVSKATTGNLEVYMVPCEAGVFLTQVVGEYEQRLAAEGLELITRKSDIPLYIMADGRLIWREFDNLLSNILKYAQPGTRVYLTMEEVGEYVEIAFKNTSRYRLDVSSDELKERFVRGDNSRNTEGNGLGLAIVESLTTLQGGEMNLTIDGDFFKVVLRFPALREEIE